MNHAPFLSICCLALLAPAAGVGAETLPLPGRGDSLVGTARVVYSRAEDTLLDIARHHGQGYEAIRNANPEVDPWLPGAGTPVTLPRQHVLPDAERRGIVINIPEMRLYYYPPARRGQTPRVMTYPIGIGKEGWPLPEMQTRISGKERNPAWRVPASIRQELAEQGEMLPEVIAPGPDNPLGAYAMRLGPTKFLIHGSNKTYGIGMRVSHGCIRLAPRDIRELFGQVTVGTPVRIVNQPYKAGRLAGRLYLEAHPPLTEYTEASGKTAMVAAIIRATGEGNYAIDWSAALGVAEAAKGIPSVVGTAEPERRH